MTELLFQTDSYLKEFDATVLEADETGVVLNRTAFYPGGGGQPYDIGTITQGETTWKVVKLERRDGAIWHKLEGDAPLPAAGSMIHGQIDWARRYQLMRTHTALHILCGVIWRDYGAQVTGGNMESLKARMDFEFERMEKALVQEIEKAINAEVAAERDVRIKILPRKEAFQIPDLIRTKINLLPPQISEVRTVEIVGLDLQADGGTHVHNTREVGNIKIVDYKSKGRINKRLMIALEPAQAGQDSP